LQIIEWIENLKHEVFGAKYENQENGQISDASLFYFNEFFSINELFINENHFSAKISEWKSNIRLLDFITKMDLITIALHECAHARIRQINSLLNFFSMNFAI
jgi:hypothetical protein